MKVILIGPCRDRHRGADRTGRRGLAMLPISQRTGPQAGRATARRMILRRPANLRQLLSRVKRFTVSSEEERPGLSEAAKPCPRLRSARTPSRLRGVSFYGVPEAGVKHFCTVHEPFTPPWRPPHGRNERPSKQRCGFVALTGRTHLARRSERLLSNLAREAAFLPPHGGCRKRSGLADGDILRPRSAPTRATAAPLTTLVVPLWPARPRLVSRRACAGSARC